ncbi:MAG: enolase C-terminal domain-like protein [Candidatus Paceibacterota bacterium]|jgi:enolase
MKIENANLKIIKDSRGNDTLEAELFSGGFSVVDSVPAGKSTGSHEAAVLAPQDALQKFEQIKPQILTNDWQTQEEFDNFLIPLNGSNLELVLSLAFARLKAKTENIELFQYVNNISQIKIEKFILPKPILNVINGGVHSGRQDCKLDFQEFQVIPKTEDFALGISTAREFYRKLGDCLVDKYGKENVSLGDEAGYSAPFQNNEEALDILLDLINENNYLLSIGLDSAATHFYLKEKGVYVLSGKEYLKEDLRKYYLELIEQYGIIFLEDPFEEEDFDLFAELQKEAKECLIVADDLTTTNPERLKIAIEKKAGNTILIKPNQIGTLTETLSVVRMAYESGWQAVVSHRSGETMDSFISDLAVGIGAWGLKAGAPGAQERLVKYERVLEIGQKI